MKRFLAIVFAVLSFAPGAFAGSPAPQDANWEGTVDSDWTNPANWNNGVLPNDPLANNVQVFSTGVHPIISTAGNTLNDPNSQMFVASEMTIAAGGEISGMSAFITGHVADHDPVVINGTLSTNPGPGGGFFNLSGTTAGRGDVIIDGGLVQAVQLSIYTPRLPVLTLTNGGSLELWNTLPNENNPAYWMSLQDPDADGPLEAYIAMVPGPGEAIQITVDPTTSAQFPVGRRIFTAVPIPEPSCLALLSLGGLATLLRRRR